MTVLYEDGLAGTPGSGFGLGCVGQLRKFYFFRKYLPVLFCALCVLYLSLSSDEIFKKAGGSPPARQAAMLFKENVYCDDQYA